MNQCKEAIMLCLTRSYEQFVIINGNIKVTVLGIDKRGTVRLGFEAPEDVSIVREELLEKD
jgi:carbon storage regulator CsrA